MRRSSWRFVTAHALLVALVPWCLGCATGYYVKSAPGPAAESATGALEVRVYENGPARSHGILSHRAVTIELYGRDSNPEKLVHQDTSAYWSVAGLAPGRYQLRVWWPDEKGAGPYARPSSKRVVVTAGQATAADVVLKDAGKSWLVTTGGFVAFVAVLVVALKASGWSPLGSHL